MYYCHNCRKKFRKYRRRCPICGGRCYPGRDVQKIRLIAIICIAVVLLLVLLLTLPQRNNQNDAPSTDQTTQPTTQPQTVVTEPSDPPPTESVPTVPLYTREELEGFDNTYYGYGPGPNLPEQNNRPQYAMSEQSKYEQYGANFIAPDSNTIYLTFDCGYEYRIKDQSGNEIPVTSLILDTLKKKNVKAVFFVTMHYVKSEPELVKRMIDEGHAVGNHSNTHPVMTSLTIDEMIDEVMILHNYVQEHFDYTMTLFRPPTGAFSVRSLAVVQNLGYKNVHWSFAHADWDTENQPDVANSLQTVLDKSHSGAIYLLHAISETNAALLGDAIDGLRAKGYSIELFQ